MNKHTVHVWWKTHLAFPTFCPPITSVFRDCCNFPYWILNNILLSEDIWGDRLDWPSTTSHTGQDRTETVTPALGNDSRMRETGRKLSPVISVFKSVLIIACVLFCLHVIPWTTIINLEDWDSTVTVGFSWSMVKFAKGTWASLITVDKISN